MILQVCDVIPAGTGIAAIKVQKLIINHFCVKHQYSCVLIATIGKIQLQFKRHTYNIL